MPLLFSWKTFYKQVNQENSMVVYPTCFCFQFSLCIEDLVPVALGRYVKALVSSMHQAEKVGYGAPSSSEQILEKLFSLFIEQGYLWPEICGFSEIKGPETSETSLYGYGIFISLILFLRSIDQLNYPAYLTCFLWCCSDRTHKI